MVETKQSHHHPDYDQRPEFHGEMWAHPGMELDQRIKAVEEQIKKLQNEVNDLKHKLEAHDHPHAR